MKTVGLIAEYNPFHNGHLYHLKKSKEITQADYIIVVMSGNFVQRGEPAIIDKWARTNMALKAGADIVIELPVVYATASAEFFGLGSVSILHKSRIVDSICFGSENGNLNLLSQIAAFLCNESKDFQINLRKYLSKGLTFPIARNKALLHILKENDNFIKNEDEINELLSSPNNILGIEYLKALINLNSSIEPFTIKREGASYHSTNMESTIASATGIRNALKNNQLHLLNNTIPKECMEIFMKNINRGSSPIYFDDFSSELQYLLRTVSKNELQNFMEISEGLENRILNCASSNFLISELTQAVKTKRYTMTRIQRALMHIILHIQSKDFWEFHNNGGPQYLRILGFKKSATPLLKKLKQNSMLPIISNFKKSYKDFNGLAKKMLEIESMSTDIYKLHTPNHSQRLIGTEFSSSLIILDK